MDRIFHIASYYKDDEDETAQKTNYHVAAGERIMQIIELPCPEFSCCYEWDTNEEDGYILSVFFSKLFVKDVLAKHYGYVE